MRNIIAVDYNPGSMGSFLLWNLFKKFPRLDKQKTVLTRPWVPSNHHVRPDFEIYNAEQAKNNNILTAINNHTYFTITAHNTLSLLSPEILEKIIPIRINTTLDDLPTVIFFFWYKAGRFMLDYVNNSGDAFAPGMFRQLVRCVQETVLNTTAEHTINFTDLSNVDNINACFDKLALPLDSININHELHSIEYKRSVQLLVDFKDRFEQFRIVVEWIYAQLMANKTADDMLAQASDIWQVFESTLDEFTKTMSVINTTSKRR